MTCTSLKAPHLFVVAILCWMNVSTPAAAQERTVGLPSDAVSPIYAQQEKAQWCWAASIEMLLRYYGVQISQKDVVARSYPEDPNGDLPDRPGDLETISANLNNWSVDPSRGAYVVSSTVGFGPPPPVVFLSELAARRPVLLAYKTGPKSGHAVLATAATYIDTPYGPFIQSVTVRDPWPTSGGRVTHSANVFAATMEAFWIVRVSGSQPTARAPIPVTYAKSRQYAREITSIVTALEQDPDKLKTSATRTYKGTTFYATSTQLNEGDCEIVLGGTYWRYTCDWENANSAKPLQPQYAALVTGLSTAFHKSGTETKNDKGSDYEVSDDERFISGSLGFHRLGGTYTVSLSLMGRIDQRRQVAGEGAEPAATLVRQINQLKTNSRTVGARTQNFSISAEVQNPCSIRVQTTTAFTYTDSRPRSETRATEVIPLARLTAASDEMGQSGLWMVELRVYPLGSKILRRQENGVTGKQTETEESTTAVIMLDVATASELAAALNGSGTACK